MRTMVGYQPVEEEDVVGYHQAADEDDMHVLLGVHGQEDRRYQANREHDPTGQLRGPEEASPKVYLGPSVHGLT